MSDTGRKSMTSQLGDKMKPDSQKTTTEKMGDAASGMGDRVAGAVQPDSQKSATQRMGDSTRSGGDNASGQGRGMAQSVSDMASNAAQGVKDTMNSAMGSERK